MITSDQLKDVLARVDALHKYLDIDKKKIAIDNSLNTLGTHNIKIRLHKKVDATLKVTLK